MTSSPAMSAAARGRETPDAGAFLGKEGGINPSLALHSNCPGEPQRAWPQAEQCGGTGGWNRHWLHRDPPHCRIPARPSLPAGTGMWGFPRQDPAPEQQRVPMGVTPEQQHVPMGLGLTPEQQQVPMGLGLTREQHLCTSPRAQPRRTGPRRPRPQPQRRPRAAGHTRGHTRGTPGATGRPRPAPRAPAPLTVTLCPQHHGGCPRPCPSCRAGRGHLQPRCFRRDSGPPYQ